MLFDLTSFIKTVGYIGVGGVVFAESGLLIGAVLPGDSLLFTAGFLASQGYLHIVPLIIVTFVTAVLGDNVGYWLGRRFGPSVFSREDSFFLNKGHIDRANEFYAKHGPRAIILARFVPVARTLAPILAGVGAMKWSTFVIYNIVGGVVWAIGLPLAGFWLGNAIPDVDRYLLPIIGLILVLSVAPGFYHFFKDADNRRVALQSLRKLFRRS